MAFKSAIKLLNVVAICCVVAESAVNASTLFNLLITASAPLGPCGPVAPVSPLSPLGPVAPAGPVSPLSPFGPTGPGVSSISAIPFSIAFSLSCVINSPSCHVCLVLE